MSTPTIANFSLYRDRYTQSPALIPKAPLWVDNVVLPANTVANYTVPATARVVLFSYSDPNVYTSFTGTAAIPAANVSNGAGVDICPSSAYLSAGDVISFICANAAKVAIKVYGG